MYFYYMSDADTIVAISTPPGEGGIGIVRLSGSRAESIAGEVFIPKSGRPLTSHRIRYGVVRDPVSGEDIDEVLCALMRAPHTYTREDVVEINCHGGMQPLGRVLELCLSLGARLAEPGEFTRRAFLNGRVDLAQAEATIDLIRAKTALAEKQALHQLRGALSRKINALREQLLRACAHVEACIDFPEEEIEPDSLAEIKGTLRQVAEDLDTLCATYAEGRYLREGVRTAIVGRPNVGKSSLLNALLERDRVIVTDVPGTTRDVIEEYLNIRGVPLRLMDTAGIREAHDMAESEGVRRSLQALEDADIALGVIDGSEALHREDAEVLERLGVKRAVLVVNKSDLPARAELPASGLPTVFVSAKTGAGLETLRQKILETVLGSSSLLGEGLVITNLRHRGALAASGKALRAALATVEREPLEITAMELREALDRLGEIVGAVSTEDILERVFSEFCIGK
jgi:tRNA modification GTPase